MIRSPLLQQQLISPSTIINNPSIPLHYPTFHSIYSHPSVKPQKAMSCHCRPVPKHPPPLFKPTITPYQNPNISFTLGQNNQKKTPPRKYKAFITWSSLCRWYNIESHIISPSLDIKPEPGQESMAMPLLSIVESPLGKCHKRNMWIVSLHLRRGLPRHPPISSNPCSQMVYPSPPPQDQSSTPHTHTLPSHPTSPSLIPHRLTRFTFPASKPSE